MTIPLIVSMGYGFEHEVYLCTRDMWSMQRRFFKDVADIVFFRTTRDYKPEQYSYSDGEYLFGPSQRSVDEPDTPRAAWNLEFIVDRQLKLYKRLLQDYPQPFWLFATTLTSAVDFHALRLIVDQLTCKNCFAGAVEYAAVPTGSSLNLPEGTYLRFMSGAGTLLSSDLMALVLSRANSLDQVMLNDIWLSLVLRDIPRIPLMRHDFTDITSYTNETRQQLRDRVIAARQKGHYHFRVRSGRWAATEQINHDATKIDTLVLNDILAEIHSSPVNPTHQLEAWQQYRSAVADHNGGALLPFGNIRMVA